MKSIKNMIINLLTLSFVTFSTTSLQATSESYQTCFNASESKKISEAILDLKKCEISLISRERLIQERLTKFPDKSGPTFWQEPYFIAGGFVVSFSVGALAGFYFATKE